MTTKEKHNVTNKWRKKGIKSELTGLIVAPEDLEITLPDGTKKTHFTFDEAIRYTKNLPGGWRLPTRGEWVMLAEEFGCDPKTGKLDGNRLKDALKLDFNGWVDSAGKEYGVGGYGYYWSSVVDDDDLSYALYFGADGNLYPQYYDFRSNGNSVRCVAR